MVALRCIDQANVSQELLPDVTVPGFRELGTYFFIAPLDGVDLYIDEAPAEAVQVGGQSGWRWTPGFYAGVVVAELLSHSGQRLAEYRLDVAPEGSKLGEGVFHTLLEELRAFDPALLLGTEAAQASIGVSGEVTSPLLAYARLRRNGDALQAALRAVMGHPLTRLQCDRALVPAHHVRRLDVASAVRLLRHPATVAYLNDDAGELNEKTPLIEATQSTDTVDNPANRALVAVMPSVRLRCQHVADALAVLARVDEKAGTRTPLQPRLARKLAYLGGLSKALARLLKGAPFALTTRAEVTAAGLNAISAHPAYARAYRFAWSSLRGGVAGDLADEQTWLSPTWEIYERWCFAQVVQCLRKQRPDLSWTTHYPTTRNDCIRVVGAGDGVQMEAWLQRRYRAGDSTLTGFRSISAELHPDIVITVDDRGVRRMFVLDAKYRTSRINVLDAMRSAHLYQDALRWDEARPVCSLLLVPRGGGAPWLEAPEFHAAHQVGVLPLAPDTRLGLSVALERWLPTSAFGAF
ncbi:TPA: DUF2357 domain-containing protein [Stenotrophomonas maltophilia]|uniref:DUF2357 domain-containing protein n=1 Tax=Stenotrophomonas maltophilia TaxID=40324 RepID=UPI000C15AFCE|nr:DUF2357 domain-containing protein [Stenotrophomonas maltophilia]